jgi:predicted nucleic acid-binding protein
VAKLVPVDTRSDDIFGCLKGVMEIVEDIESPAFAPEEWEANRSFLPEIAALAWQFPDDFPHDPADRLIAATARAEGMTLITRDLRIRQSPLLKTLW